MTEKEEKAIKDLKRVIYKNTYIDIDYDELDEFRENFEIVLQALEQRINNQKIFAKEYEKISKQLNCEVKDNLEKTKLINLLKRRAIITENEQKEILKIQEKFLEKDFQDCLIIYFQKKERKERKY